MITYDTSYVCHACKAYVPIAGYSMQPDNPPLVIESECPSCAKQYSFSISERGEIAATEL